MDSLHQTVAPRPSDSISSATARACSSPDT
jgi:hypothetical protein